MRPRQDPGGARAPVVTICGVAGHNRGDDAIALALVAGLRARVPEMQARVAMLRLGAILPAPGLTPFLAARRHPVGLAGLARSIAAADLVILGGGSVIQDKFGGGRVTGMLGYSWMVAWLARLFGRALITAPIGVDALATAPARRIAAELLAPARAITVRDTRSLAEVTALLAGRAAPAPVLACDPAFAFAGAPPRDEGPVVLAPAFEGECDTRVAAIFARIAALAVARLDRDVVIVAMDERDAAAAEAVATAVPASARARVSTARPATLDATLAILRGAAALIAMRLHAMILCYAASPIACLSRTTKTDAFMADYAVPGTALHGADVETIAALLVEAVARWPERATQAAILTERRVLLDTFYDQTATLLVRAAETRR
ncbi:polysaccharide pyruvyl transferase family protein [Sphingomonas citri]